MKKLFVKSSLIVLAVSTLSSSVLAEADVCSSIATAAPEFNAAVEGGNVRGQVSEYLAASKERLDCEIRIQNHNQIIASMHDAANELKKVMKDNQKNIVK